MRPIQPNLLILTIPFVCLSFALASCDRSEESQFTDLDSGKPQDLTFAIQVELQGGISYSGRLKIKGERARTDFELPGGLGDISTIQLSSGEEILLNHTTQTWQHQPVAEVPTKGLTSEESDYMKKALPMKFTGNTQAITGWECEEFLMAHYGAIRMVAWVAKDFPDGAKIQRHFQRVGPIQETLKNMEQLTGKTFQVPGFALKYEIIGEFSMTITAIGQGEVSESEFEVPKNYLQSLSRE